MTRPPWEDRQPDEKPQPDPGPGLPPGIELPDGGNNEAGDTDDLPQLHVGDHVQDRQEDDPDEAATMLVVGTPAERADEVAVDDDLTVADVNPEFPADDHVVEAVFPQRTTVDVGRLQTYAYPRSRLERVARLHSEEDDDA
ncbi:hypothetical protein HZS55_15805 [Halosimplex rubrum]|uniref:Uncharacterized protein n=1 Tax=Halosimplex rubrum TaxID=869889 RepID=A0A7D5P6M9_9EURY|nr:hypothetical protein [Halosimplex rubrum]QLH78662.1 hypothetical protein HZS55_15805 [Halosimplex rubrum]